MRRTIAQLLRRLADQLQPQPTTSLVVAERPAEPTLLDRLYASLQKLDFQPQHIVDVGANRGHWTQKTLEYFPNAYYTLLEPQPQMRAAMQELLDSNSRISLHSVGAAANNGELAFTITSRDDSCTFCLSELEASKFGWQQVSVPVVRLDDLLRSQDRPAPTMIKIDAEGCDLEVLQGARESLKACEVLFVEAAIMCKMFRNDLRSVVNAAHELGFKPLEFADLNRTQKHGSLWLTEVVFTRVGGQIDVAVDSYI
ncbi:MAG: FkbM family methyltransferase [Planctomycetaceae bacterium]